MTGGEVHLWYGRAGPHSPGDRALLSRTERERADSYADPVTAAHYRHAHIRIREILAGYLECGAAGIELGRHPCPGCGDLRHGRPRISRPHTDISFSLSRCGADWLLAVAPDGRRVGVDIERVRPLAAFDGLVRRCLTPREREFVRHGDAADRHGRFLHCWVRKEALLKGHGTGIATDLAAVETRAAGAGSGAGAVWRGLRTQDVLLGPGLAACVAVDQTPGPSADPAVSSQSACPDSSKEPKRSRCAAR